MWDQSLTELFYRGGSVMWPLLACSIFAAALAVERLAVFCWLHTNPKRLWNQIRSLVTAGKVAEARRALAEVRSPVARAAESYLSNLHRPQALRDEIVSRTATEQMSRLERRLNWLSTVGALAPMLGLLGTVTGLIAAFHRIELANGQVQPSDLAAGIWEALLTTVFGLVIAIPTMAVFHGLDQWAGRVAIQMELIVSYLNDWLDEGPAKRRRTEPRPADGAEAPGLSVSAT